MTRTVRLGDLELPGPVLTAAGCGGTGKELAAFTDLAELAAFTTRTVTLDPRPGAAAPRVVPTAAGLLTDTGLHNPGLQTFLATELPWLAARQVRTIVSVHAGSLAEYAELARRVGSSPGVAAELTEELATRGIDDPADAVGVGHLPTEGTMP
jgi:dihydroorotate dehydrogenase (NAD+) catalytic subunit